LLNRKSHNDSQSYFFYARQTKNSLHRKQAIETRFAAITEQAPRTTKGYSKNSSGNKHFFRNKSQGNFHSQKTSNSRHEERSSKNKFKKLSMSMPTTPHKSEKS
jgi:hypothetical protein